MESTEDNTKKKFFTKERVIAFVIGLLSGAVITAAAFLVYINVAGVGTNNSEQSMQMPGGMPPEMFDGEGPDEGTLPELPDGEAPDGEMPDGEMPSDSSDGESTDGEGSESGRTQPPAKPSQNKTKNSES